VIPAGTPSTALNRAVESPLVRGGLTLVFGVLTGNAIGFLRVAITAYLLGTHSRADALAVALGPIDNLNSVLINSVVFAFVPLLTAREGADRAALFLQLTRCWIAVSAAISALAILAAPALMRALAPGLDPAYFGTSVVIFRIMALSTVAAGAGAVQCALLYTARRFAPTAFYQAALNACTSVCALALWKVAGVYAFAIGYTLGAWLQLAIVWVAARRGLDRPAPHSGLRWPELLAKPAFFVVYSAGLSANLIFTRAYATHAGPGMAAALDYCMKGVGVPLALLVSPISTSLLPEIARRTVRDALRLIDKTIGVAALAASGICGFALLLREPAIAFFFERGNFTAESTRMVSAVFLGFGSSIVGWSLIEITARSLFGMNRPWPPVVTAAIPVMVNVIVTNRLHAAQPEWLGAGASIGLLAGFLTLFAILHLARKNWSEPTAAAR
jgi:putative peptidoglycan lipid II flippase